MKKYLLPLVLLLSLVAVGAACKSKTDSGGSNSDSGRNSGGSNSSGSNSGVSSSSGSSNTGPAYKDPDGKFSLTLPPGFSQFQSQKTSQPTPAGPIELNILQSQSSSGACIAGYSDFPEASWEGRTPQKMLEDGRDGALKNINGTLEKQEKIIVQGREGLAVYGSANAGGKQVYLRFNFILDKPRAYQVGYLAYDRAAVDAPDIEAYFNSFTLNGPAPSSSK